MKFKKIFTLTLLALFLFSFVIPLIPKVSGIYGSEEILVEQNTNSSSFAITTFHPSADGLYSGFAETFTLDGSYNITKIALQPGKNTAYVTANFSLSIYATSSSQPTGAALATSPPVNGSDIPVTYPAPYMNFTLTNGFVPTSGTEYAFAVVADDTGGILDTSNSTFFMGVLSSVCSGNYSRYHDSAWETKTYELTFTIYGTEEVAAPVASDVDRVEVSTNSYLSSNWTDTTGLSYYKLESNFTGTLTNSSATAFSGETWSNITVPYVSASFDLGEVALWRIFANNTYGVWGATEQRYIVGNGNYTHFTYPQTFDLAANITNDQPSNYAAYQTRNFYAEGLHWFFYYNVGSPASGSHYIFWQTSIDGKSWGETHQLFTNPFYDFGLVYNGTYVSFAVSNGDILYRMYSPESDGSLTDVTGEWQVVADYDDDSEYKYRPNIALDNDNKPWIFWINTWGLPQTQFVDHSIYSNGTWESAGGNFPYEIVANSSGAMGAGKFFTHLDGTMQLLFANMTDYPEDWDAYLHSVTFDDAGVISDFDLGIVTGYNGLDSCYQLTDTRMFVTHIDSADTYLAEFNKTSLVSDVLVYDYYNNIDICYSEEYNLFFLVGGSLYPDTNMVFVMYSPVSSELVDGESYTLLFNGIYSLERTENILCSQDEENGMFIITSLDSDDEGIYATYLDLDEYFSYSGLPSYDPIINAGSDSIFYFRSDIYTVNEVSAFGLDVDQSTSSAKMGEVYGGDTSEYTFGFRVFFVSSDGNLTEITDGTPIATMSRSSNGAGYQTGTWNCPETEIPNLVTALQINLYDTTEWLGSYQLVSKWITPQLYEKKIEASTWIFNVYTSRTGGSTYSNFDMYFGDENYNSTLTGISFTDALPQEIALAYGQSGDFFGMILYPFLIVAGNTVYGLGFLFGAGVYYFRYKKFEPVLIIILILGEMLGFMIPAIAWRLFYFLLLFAFAVVLFRVMH